MAAVVLAMYGLGYAVEVGRTTAVLTATRPYSPPLSPYVSAPEPRVDLYGNPVIDAMAEYRLDRRGDVYERHAPHTELPKLKSPRS